MMISKQEFLVRAQLERETLEAWIQDEWLIPSQSAGELTFSDADIARAHLIRDLRSDLGMTKASPSFSILSTRSMVYEGC
jgi:chaperone modulatory protein CbpM